MGTPTPSTPGTAALPTADQPRSRVDPISVSICSQVMPPNLGKTFLLAARIWRMSPLGKFASKADRKSVVQGKSVSVRVDLGGRRILKQKNISQYTTTRYKYNYE